MDAVPNNGAAGRGLSDRAVGRGEEGFRHFRAGLEELRHEPEGGGREDRHLFCRREGGDFPPVRDRVGDGLVEEDALAEFRGAGEVFEVKCGVVDFEHHRVAVGNGFLKAWGDLDAPALEGLLAGVEPLLVLERGGEAEAGGGAHPRDLLVRRAIRRLHAACEFDRMACVEPDQGDLEVVGYHRIFWEFGLEDSMKMEAGRSNPISSS